MPAIDYSPSEEAALSVAADFLHNNPRWRYGQRQYQTEPVAQVAYLVTGAWEVDEDDVEGLAYQVVVDTFLLGEE
jgi:hypothetical protein